MAGIFGPTGREVFKQIQRDRAQEAAATGAQAGTLNPQQMFGQAGSFLGLAANRGLESATGAVPPEVARANKLQAAQQAVISSGVSATDPVAFNEALAEALGAQGLLDEARDAGSEAERLRQEQEETSNLQSLIAARMTVKQQQREDELAREARASEGKLDRESRERIARLGLEKKRTTTPKVLRAATGSDRATAEASIREALPPIAGELDFGDLSSDDQKNMTQWVAQRARDVASANPGLPYEEAAAEAVEQARAGLTGFGRFEKSRWTPPMGTETPRPADPSTTNDVQARADAILGL